MPRAVRLEGMNNQDRATLNDLLRLLDHPIQALTTEGARLRWTAPPALALILAPTLALILVLIHRRCLNQPPCSSLGPVWRL